LNSPIDDWQICVQQDPFLLKKARFVPNLLQWFTKNGRDLPWRQTRDPYKILVSELMLQQTQVSRILEYYPRFLEKFPDFAALAQASEKEVVKAWQGLGYYNRARNFHKLAIEIIQKYGGQFPREKEVILTLPGIGEYTAGAILTFALGIRAPIVDTNVIRVLSRIFLSPSDLRRFKTKGQKEKVLWIISEALLPQDQFWEFNQAIMDFGAIQCTASKPHCNKCPMRSICNYYETRSLTRYLKI